MESQPNPDPLLVIPPWANELANRMHSYERNLAELTRTVNEVNRKLDILVAQSCAGNVQGPEDNLAIGSAATPNILWPSSPAPQLPKDGVAASGHNPIYTGWGLDGKSEGSATCWSIGSHSCR